MIKTSIPLLGFGLLCPMAGAASLQYVVTATIDNFVGASINNSGEIVGHSGNIAQIYRAGGLTSLGTLVPSDTRSFATSINNDGAIVGYSQTSSTSTRKGFLSTDGSSLVALAATPGTSLNVANGINDAGVIVGQYSSGFTSQGWILNGSTLTSVPGLVEGGSTSATAINSIGWVTGAAATAINQSPTVGYLYDGATITSLGTLGGTVSNGLSINDLGNIVGSSTITGSASSANRAFYYNEGTMINLQAGTVWENFGGYANAINNSNQVVGYFSGAGGTAFLWEDGELYDLNDLLESPIGATAFTAVDINDQGQILVTYGPAAAKVTAVLSPVPEPSAVFLGSLGLLALLRRRRC